MFRRLGTDIEYKEIETYIDLEFIKEILENQEEEIKESEKENFDIENYIASLKNIGTSSSYNNNSYNNQYKSENSLSEQELRERYESEILREKYGDNYSETKNRNYEDYLSNKTENKNTTNTTTNTTEQQATTNNGQALVYVDLENKKRGNSYIHVPVFTCKFGGKVVINITISSDGTVKTATIASVTSNGQDASCIENAAKTAAMKSKFTAIVGSYTEKGKITYTFIDQ